MREVLPQSEELSSIVVAADVADRTAPFTVPTDSLDLVMHMFGRTNRDEIIVCDSAQSRKVVGVVTKKAVIDAYNRRIFQADLTGGFGSLVEAVREAMGGDLLPSGGCHRSAAAPPAA